MGTGHLYDLHNREDVGVERMLNLLPALYPDWYISLGIDPRAHWALVRPIFRTPTLRRREAEIDILFGHVNAVIGPSGHAEPVWPPPLDYLVAVEAKCPAISMQDTEPWANATEPKCNLHQQLQRDLDLGFHRVAALHIIAAPPSNDYWGVLNMARDLGEYYVPRAERQLRNIVGRLPVGHAVLSIAGVAWKHEGMSGGLAPMKLVPAPQVGSGPGEAIRLQIESHLRCCPAGQTSRPIFVRAKDGWRGLDT
jgi:hypothetical protein